MRAVGGAALLASMVVNSCSTTANPEVVIVYGIGSLSGTDVVAVGWIWEIDETGLARFLIFGSMNKLSK